MLANDVARYGHLPRVAQAVAGVLGCTPEMIGQANVVAHVLTDAEDLLSLYLITIGWFGVFQMNDRGDELSVCVPIERIKRVVEERRDGSIRVLIEIDADRQIAQLETFEGRTTGSVSSAFYEVGGSGELGAQIAVFAQTLRLFLNQ